MFFYDAFCAIAVFVTQHPELGLTLEKRYLAQRAGQRLVLDQTGNAGALEKTAHEADLGNGIVSIDALHAGFRSPLRNSAGSPPCSSTSTSAEPTITPSACRPMSSTCSALRTPKPAQTGRLEAALTRSR